ncbi:sugar transferase [Alteromonas sp. a30]|uniref:sugar transferase n=1 Tax=Alteromonas sp. a30 TaxID=2730917 RepID=UPI0022812C0E|nr:sugar transferase [Alteromonas sp. a30]MCY7294389.1 sugar transferase [Alteromonas sp. a30]
MYANLIKSLLDRVLAIVLLVCLSWAFILAAIVLMFSLKGNPFFVQQRPGLKGKPFNLIKFRTMNNLTNEVGELLPDNVRLTSAGKIIRSLSIDELPQLLNVIKGEMSFIGPRPLLMEYLPLYSETERHRHDVKPGITGWAQVNGRNSLAWKQKFKLDLYYVQNVSFRFDVKIALLTILKVLKREGVNASSQVTMEKYNGSN